MNKLTQSELRMQMLAGVITEGEYAAAINQEVENTEKDSLNEHMIGGIVGIGAINQIPPRAKTDYEDAFEHFLGERYQIKPNRERDDIKDVNEEEEVEEGKKGKMYFHVLEDGGYGEIGHQGVYDTKEEAQNRADSLSDMFPDSSFYVEASDSEDEPYSVTMEEGKEEIEESRISPDNAVAYLENTLGHVWNMGTGKNNINFQSLAQSIAQDLGLIEDLEEGKEIEEPNNY